jgi:hypothetical protein
MDKPVCSVGRIVCGNRHVGQGCRHLDQADRAILAMVCRIRRVALCVDPQGLRAVCAADHHRQQPGRRLARTHRARPGQGKREGHDQAKDKAGHPLHESFLTRFDAAILD